MWVNGNAGESWPVEHEGVTNDLPPFGWLAIGADDFYECSLSVDGKRYDRVGSPECIFLDGRGTWRDFDGIGASGSIAVRRAKEGKGLSITTIEAVDRLMIAKPAGVFGREDVRSAIGAIAQAQAITARALDQNDKDLGEVTIRRTESGWEIQPPKSTVRLDITVK